MSAADLTEGGEAPAQAWFLEGARAVTARVADLKAELEATARLPRMLQERDAIARTELTDALHAALIGQAELGARTRSQLVASFAARHVPRGRRHNRLSKLLDRLLARLGGPGRSILIARAGLGARQGLFDADWYRAANPDVSGDATTALAHYLVSGDGEGRSPHPLFDARFYRDANARDLAATGLSALEHYARIGGGQGRDPHPLFQVGHYLAQGASPARGEDALSHYLRQGWTQGLSPSPLFDVAWYAGQAGSAAHVQPPLAHYLTDGWRHGLSPHPLVDPAWYLTAYPDVAAAGVEPLTHFLRHGAELGLSPGPWFDVPHYVAQRGPALPAGANPLVDYLQGGAWQVAEPCPGFPSAAYVAGRPELVRQGLTPLEHWARRQGR